MEFNKAYNRQEFVNFLQNSFLPEDFVPSSVPVAFRTQMKYSTQAIKLGSSSSLDLVVYEVRHTSKHDARVSLSKEAFRMLADEMEDRALVIFIPQDSSENYRFSFIEITLDAKDDSSQITRSYSNPRRYSYYLGEGIAYYTPNKYLNAKGRVVNPEDLRSRFSVEVLTKEFYQELSDWYDRAIKIIRFPNDLNDKTDDDKFNNESAIRLITRLIFVWFLKQRNLIPWQFFDETYIRDNLIENFDPHEKENLFGYKSYESKYYKAILQNLFFAMLNSPITSDGHNELSERHFRKGRGDYDNNKLMRYESYFKNPQLFVDLANKTVPFLNGGLFDCLDEKDKGLYYDGFSDRDLVKNTLKVPDYLFFGEEVEKDIETSRYYDDKRKKGVSARGIIDILKRYNFTVEENTPFDQEVSLDPELLGKVFENLLASYNPETQTPARKQTGSFYTPREIVQYMVDESLVSHLKRTVGDYLEEKYRHLMRYTDEDVSLTDDQKKQIMQSLYNCKVLDPACGSGAFPMGMLQQMVHILSRIDPDNTQWKEMMLNMAINETSEAYRTASSEERMEIIADIERSFDESINRPDYARKLYLIENCIYGVDIQPIAIQISKLRFFISLVVDQKTNTDPFDNFGIRPLPNLEAKFVAANTLIGLDKNAATMFDTDEILSKKEELKVAKHKIFGAKTVRTKRKYKEEVNRIRYEIADLLRSLHAVDENDASLLASWDMFDQNASSPFFDPEWMFDVKDGFDIVIGNPPYISTKGIATSDKIAHEKEYGFSDDTYNLFTFKGLNLCKEGGVLTFITPKTFWTTQTKRNMRDLLLKNTIDYIFDTANPFDVVMVDTCIFQVCKKPFNSQHLINFIDGTQNLIYPHHYNPISQKVYINTQGAVIFKPTKLNLRIHELYGEKVKELYDKWWDKIKTSKDIAKNKIELEKYRASLKPGDIALLGCLTEGGQGLATANNGKYIAVRSSTKWARNIILSRPKKLSDAIKKYSIKIPQMEYFNDEKSFLESLSEKEVANLFDRLKEKYGRDIFGQGYIYKIIDDKEIADVDSLTQDEKENGIDTSKNYYVPYDKGDKDGNRWYLETPFAIAWSKENVQFLKTNSGKKGEGMPVVRDPQFYFREGLCWSDINTTFLKCRKKQKSIHDVKSMSIFGLTNKVPEDYIIVLINSTLISYYVDNFVNNTQTFQINDARQLPIIIPALQDIVIAHNIIKDAIQIKNNYKLTTLNELQKKVDSFIKDIYHC